MAKSTDRELRQKAREYLANDGQLRNYGLKVDVINGTVLLQGIVDSFSEKERASEIVRGVPGIKEVQNSVSISTDGTIRNEDVTMEAQEELERDPAVNVRHIGAESIDGNGTVFLKGRTTDPEELEAARRAVAKARGVTKVVSQVKVGPGEMSLADIFHSQVRNDGD